MTSGETVAGIDARGAEAGPCDQFDIDKVPLPCVVVELGRLVERGMGDALRRFDISAAHFMALECIARRPDIHRATLAVALEISPQAVGGILTQLEARGLIGRSSTGPGHPISITVTREGRQLLEMTVPVLREISRQLVFRLAPGRGAALDGDLRRLLVGLRRVIRPTKAAPPRTGPALGRSGPGPV